MGCKSNSFLSCHQLFKLLTFKPYDFYWSSFKMECKMACKNESKRLKMIAHQKLVT